MIRPSSFLVFAILLSLLLWVIILSGCSVTIASKPPAESAQADPPRPLLLTLEELAALQYITR